MRRETSPWRSPRVEFRARARTAVLLATFLCGALPFSARTSVADLEPGELGIARVTVNEVEVADTATIQVLVFGELQPAPMLRDQVVLLGDVVVCLEPGVALRLVGPQGKPQVNLRSPFRVAVAPRRADGAAVIDLMAGEVHVQSSEPTEVRAGEARIGTRGTTYAVRVDRAGGTTALEALVFDGEIAVSSGEGPVALRAGGDAAMVRFERQGPVVRTAVPPATLESTARLYAALDVDTRQVAARGVDPRAALEQLTSAYAQVLAAPRDADARLSLAAQKVRLDSREGLAYQLDRVVADPRRNRDLWLKKTLVQAAGGDPLGLKPTDVRTALEETRARGVVHEDLLSPEGWAEVARWTSAADVRADLERGRYDEARSKAEALDGQGPATLYLSLSAAALQQRRTDDAERYGSLAMQRDATRRELDARQARGLWDLWRAARTAGPWAALDSWAFRLLDLGLHAEAAECFAWLTSRSSGGSRAFYGLGLAKARAGDPASREAARGAMREALARTERDQGLSPREAETARRLAGLR
jgi:hypothetical protein